MFLMASSSSIPDGAILEAQACMSCNLAPPSKPSGLSPVLQVAVQ